MPRAGLTPGIVVATAGDIADESGWDELSLSVVAGRLDVKVPSLYKHVASLDALRTEVATAATRDLAEALSTATVGVAGSQALHALCHAYRTFAVAWPGRYAATQRASSDPRREAASDAVLRIVNAVLAGYGIAGDDAVDAARAVRAGLHGFAALETSGGFGLPQDVDRSFRRMVEGFDLMLTGWARRA